MAQQRYKSEVFVPIKKDEQTFEARQRGIWDDLHGGGLLGDMHEAFRRRTRRADAEREQDDLLFWAPREMEYRLQQYCHQPARCNCAYSGIPNDYHYPDSGTSTPERCRSELGLRALDPHLRYRCTPVERPLSETDVHPFYYPPNVRRRPLDRERSDMAANVLERERRERSSRKRMQRRRKEWEGEVERMRKDFFRLKPQAERKDSSDNLLDTMKLDDIFSDTGNIRGDKKFHVSFDVSQFRPDEISVRTEEQKLVVHAKHEEKGEKSNMSREFSRQVDIPKHVDPQALSSTLSKDGILQVEAPVPAPAYDQIRDTTPVSNAPPTRDSPVRQRLMQDYQAGPVVRSEDGTKQLKMEVEVGTDFRPDEVVVKTIDRKLVVHARHEEKSAGRTSVREFSREFDLPSDVDPNSVTASMTDDGRLLVEAPMGSFQKGHYEGSTTSTKQPKVTIELR